VQGWRQTTPLPLGRTEGRAGKEGEEKSREEHPPETNASTRNRGDYRGSFPMGFPKYGRHLGLEKHGAQTGVTVSDFGRMVQKEGT